MDERIIKSFKASLIYGAEKGLQSTYFECVKELETTAETKNKEFETLFNLYLEVLTILENFRDGGIPF